MQICLAKNWSTQLKMHIASNETSRVHMMRAAILVHQLSRYASTTPDLPISTQLTWSDDDDMKPTKRSKRRERRSRPRKGFTSMQVHAALDLLANQTAQDLAKADFSAFERKLSWQELAQGVIESLARSLLELEDVPETAERAHLLWHRLEARRDVGVRTTKETQDAIELMRRTSGCVSALSAAFATVSLFATSRPPFDAHPASSRFGIVFLLSLLRSLLALPPYTD